MSCIIRLQGSKFSGAGESICAKGSLCCALEELRYLDKGSEPSERLEWCNSAHE